MTMGSNPAEVVLTSIDHRGIATVTLNRPDVHNAYDQGVIQGLADAFGRLAQEPKVRLVLLRGNGRHFQAGADLAFLKSLSTLPDAQNLAMSELTVATVAGLAAFPLPTLALVQGGCFGGGVGLVAACDMAIATSDAVFSLTEVRWGITAAPILPVLLRAIGFRAVGRYGLTGERFDATEARRLGLIHEIAEPGGLDKAAEPIIEALLMAAPEAVATTKRLSRQVLEQGLDHPGLDRMLAADAASRRRSPEAAEGLASFLEKRKPGWYSGPP
jgi:methylglutaconyl-CoA hydratase